MKKLLFILSVIFISCNANKKEDKIDENKSKLFAQLQNLANDANKESFDVSFHDDVSELKIVDSATMGSFSAQFDLISDGEKKTFTGAFGVNTYILNYLDNKEYVFLSAFVKGEDHKSLYFVTLPKQNRNASIYLVGDAVYDEFNFMSYLAGKKIDKDSYDFSLINTSYDFPDGLEQGKEYISEKDSISFNIKISETGKIDKKVIDSIRTVSKVKMAVYDK